MTNPVALENDLIYEHLVRSEHKLKIATDTLKYIYNQTRMFIETNSGHVCRHTDILRECLLAAMDTLEDLEDKS